MSDFSHTNQNAENSCEPPIIISRRALAREGHYEMMSVFCVRACVCALVSHADFSKTATATDFL